MGKLLTILKQELEKYAVDPMNGVSYLTSNKDETVFVVSSIAFTPKHSASSELIVRIIDDHIVIERDMNNKILCDALIQAGIPREQIVLAYAGETVKAPSTTP